MSYYRSILLFLVLAILGLAAGAGAQPFAATASLSSNQAFVGQPIQLYVQVQGTETPTQPDVSGISDFTVKYLATQPRTSSQVTIINGRRTENVQRAAVIVYELTPKQAGTFTIPSLTVTNADKQVQTPVLRVVVKEPEESDEVKLRIQLSRNECYVGEPIHATWTLYFRASLRDLKMTLPLLLDPAFAVPDYDPPVGRNRKAFQVVLDGHNLVLQQGEGRLDGKDYSTLTFEKVLIPQAHGKRLLPASTAVVEVVVGQRRTNDFFNRLQPVTKPVAVPSNSPELTVKELPAEGRPANFAGHVGRYQVSTVASPTAVNVGDPIELTVTLSGPEFLDAVECPDLEHQGSLAQDFRISPPEVGEMQDGVKVFKRTLRATHPDVKEIPAIELPYFDPATGTYGVARSNPIPLTVRAAKLVTAQDAEGTSPNLPATRKLKTRAQGLAANYEDASVLRNQRAGIQAWLASPGWLATLAGLPLAYLILAIATAAYRRRHADPAALRARRAGAVCLRALNSIHSGAEAHERALAAVRNYCGAKFGLAAGALTYQDVAPHLAEAQVPEPLRDSLRLLFEHCEAGRYSGAASVSAGELIPQAIDTIRRIDKSIAR